VGYRKLCSESWAIGVEEHWVAQDCYCGRRNLGNFFNRGCRCSSTGCFVRVD